MISQLVLALYPHLLIQGILFRDEFGDGALLGIVLENAQQKFRDAVFPPTTANQERAYIALLDSLETLSRNGITSVSDAGGFWRQAQIEAWTRALNEDKLTVRASNALYIYPDEPLDSQLPKLKERFNNDKNSLLRFNQAKIYVDGILSLHTSALYEAYEGSDLLPAEELGFEYFENLNDISKQLVDEGFQLHFHVTGDRGAGIALDAIENLGGGDLNSSSGPSRLTHCYLIDEVDRSRFADLGAIADFQVAPSSFGEEYRNSLKGTIGTTRESQLLPALEIHNAGGIVTLSSDWDADSLSPLVKLETALTKPVSGKPFPDLETVIPMLTINSAILLQQEDRTGSIEVGKFADLVVLDTNIFDIPVNEISKTKVVTTILQGKITHGKGAATSSSYQLLSLAQFSLTMATSWIVADLFKMMM